MEQSELPNIVALLANSFGNTPFAKYLHKWENLIFSLIIIAALSLVAYLASRKSYLIPDKLENACESFVSGVDGFVCGIIGPRGRRFTPFIGTLFIYILSMNLAGLIPFMKSPTTSWSTTLALSICVFIYVQYTGLRELGLLGYVDHYLGKPRGVLAISVVIPLILFFLHIVSEIVRPISLSLRLRSNIWGDDMLLGVLVGFGLKGVPLLVFNIILSIVASIVQALVFCLLTTIYFALVVTPEET